MFSILPKEIRLKIKHYVYEINVSKKKNLFINIHQELLNGWWINEKMNTIYLMHSSIPIQFKYHTKEEVYNALNATFINKPQLYYNYPIPSPYSFPEDTIYVHAERIPRIEYIYNEMT